MAVVAATLLLTANMASAEGYVGFNVGKTDWGTSSDPTSFSLIGGYFFAESFSAELAYTDFGSASGFAELNGESFFGDLDGSGWRLSAVGRLPVGESFDLFAKLGVMLWDIDGDVSFADRSGRVGTDGNDFVFSIGGSYHITEAVVSTLEYERVTGDLDGLDTLSLGLFVRF